MKTRKIVCICISLLIIFAFIYVFESQYGSPRIKGHLYFGDHITLNMNINVNGKAIPLSNIKMTCNNGNEKVKLENASYKVHGGNYGMYSFEFIVPANTIEGLENDLTFDMNYINANNWYVVNINGDLLLSTASKGYNGTLSIDAQFNDGRRNQFIRDLNSDNNNKISVTWGV